MGKRQRESRWVLACGVLFTAVGLTHIGLTPVLLGEGVLGVRLNLDGLPQMDRLMGIYMFLAAGLGAILGGLLTAYASFGLRAGERWAWVVAVICGAVLLLAAVMAVGFMWNNPFAYIFALIAIANAVSLAFYGRGRG